MMVWWLWQRVLFEATQGAKGSAPTVAYYGCFYAFCTTYGMVFMACGIILYFRYGHDDGGPVALMGFVFLGPVLKLKT